MRLSLKPSSSASTLDRASARSWLFFSASTRDSISFFNVSSSKFFTELRAWVSSLSSFTRAASCSARFWMICWTSSSVLGLLVEGGLVLGLAVELHQQVAGLDGLAGARQLDDDHRPALGARQQGRRHDIEPGGLGEPREAHSPHEVTGSHRDGGGFLAMPRPRRPVVIARSQPAARAASANSGTPRTLRYVGRNFSSGTASCTETVLQCDIVGSNRRIGHRISWLGRI